MTKAGSLNRVIRGLGALLFILIVGTAGYRIIESWSVLDSLYMTVITLTTVGYGEVHPLSTVGRIFSIVLIVGGVGCALYILTTVVQYIIEGEFGIRIWRRRMEAKIRELHNHFILCGYGRVGREIANVFKLEGVKFVVIDRDEEAASQAQQAGYLVIQDDATKDEILKQARIEQARGLVVALGDDADNTYVTLSARVIRPELSIIARAGSDDAEIKLRHAGANRVVSPLAIGGRRLAELALRPVAVDFVETVLFSREQKLILEELEITENSLLSGQTVKETEEQFSGLRIMALKKKDDTLLLNPTPMTTIEEQDQLTVFGTAEQLQALETCCVAGKNEEKR